MRTLLILGVILTSTSTIVGQQGHEHAQMIFMCDSVLYSFDGETETVKEENVFIIDKERSTVEQYHNNALIDSWDFSQLGLTETTDSTGYLLEGFYEHIDAEHEEFYAWVLFLRLDLKNGRGFLELERRGRIESATEISNFNIYAIQF